jgi:hypothetical protein
VRSDSLDEHKALVFGNPGGLGRPAVAGAAERRREPLTFVASSVELRASKPKHVEGDRERTLLGVSRRASAAGGTDSSTDLGNLPLVVVPEQGVQTTDLVVLLHGLDDRRQIVTAGRSYAGLPIAAAARCGEGAGTASARASSRSRTRTTGRCPLSRPWLQSAPTQGDDEPGKEDDPRPADGQGDAEGDHEPA